MNIPTTPQTSTQDLVKQRVGSRIWRAVNYLSIYAFVTVVYGGAIITDYILFYLIETLIKDDVERYPFVEEWFNYAKVGLALLLIVSAIVHGILSTYSQVKLDLAFLKEDEL